MTITADTKFIPSEAIIKQIADALEKSILLEQKAGILFPFNKGALKSTASPAGSGLSTVDTPWKYTASKKSLHTSPDYSSPNYSSPNYSLLYIDEPSALSRPTLPSIKPIPSEKKSLDRFELTLEAALTVYSEAGWLPCPHYYHRNANSVIAVGRWVDDNAVRDYGCLVGVWNYYLTGEAAGDVLSSRIHAGLFAPYERVAIEYGFDTGIKDGIKHDPDMPWWESAYPEENVCPAFLVTGTTPGLTDGSVWKSRFGEPEFRNTVTGAYRIGRALGAMLVSGELN